MNFSLDDRHRSIRRFLMVVLGSPPWTIRTERERVEDDQRPAAVIEVASAVLPGRPARVSIPQGNVEKQQTFSIACFPVLAATAAESRLEAERVADLLTQAVTLGLVDPPAPPLPQPWPWDTAPERLPVFDYAAVPVKGAARGGPQAPYGWMWAEDYPVRPVQDPDDPLRWTVALDLRVSWEQAGRAGHPGVPASEDGFGGRFVAP